MTVVRLLLLLTGLLAGTVGAVGLLRLEPGELVEALLWLAAGVVAHDAVLAPVVIALMVAGLTVLPWWSRAPAAAAAVVLGSLTLMAVPVLGRFGARADNPTLLDRPYLAEWLLLAALVWACAVAWAVALRRAGED